MLGRTWVALAVVSLAFGQTPDIVIHHARIFRGIAGAPFAEALSIRGDRILAVGRSEDLLRTAGPATRRIDASGRLVIPGFNDSHIHLNPQPASENVRLSGPEPSWPEVRAALNQAVRETPAGPLLQAEIGSRVLEEQAAGRSALDAITKSRPIRLNTWTGHGVILNSAALRLYGILEEQRDPPGGYYQRGADGRLTGRLYEYAGFALRLPMDEPALVKAWRGIAQSLVELGITSVQNLTFDAARDRAFFVRHPQPLRIRSVEMISRWSDAAHPASEPHQPVKVILDGTPVERMAALLQPYSDSAGTSGRLNLRESEICSMISGAVAARRQLLLHAVGDRSIAAALECMEHQPATDWPAQRVRLEHADMLSGPQIQRANKLGVIVVQNPAHFTIGELMKARWGPTRASQAQPAHSLIAVGIPFALGSDGPMNPYLNIMLACMHPARPSEALSREQAVEAYTHTAAFAEFAESWKGTLEPGKAADLVVLSQDIFQVPLPELPRTKVALTIVAGRIVHEAQ